MLWLEWTLAQHTRGHAFYTLLVEAESWRQWTVQWDNTDIPLGTHHDSISTTP